MTSTLYPPIHPGELLNEEFLKPMGISAYRLAQATGLTPTHISQIIHGKRAITTGPALRIARALGLSDMYWINAQARYEYQTEQDRYAAELGRIPLLAAA